MRMKRLVICLLATIALAAPARAQKAKGGGAAVLTPAADMKFADVPGFAGVQMAVAEGDPTKGPSHFYVKFTGGFAAPLHHHTANHYVTVISGNLTLVVDGKDTKLPAGSFFSFTGKKVHETKCDAGAECLLFIDSRGKWDVLPEKAAGEKAAGEKAPAEKPAAKPAK